MDSPPSPVPAHELERRPTLFLIYTVHLDTQWRWTVRDAIRDFIPATLEGNFALMAAHPARVLSFEGAFRYELMEEYYPADFAKVRELVDRGNWRPAGSMLDSPDVNCVAPESLLRHILYANRYFEEKLGRSSADIFLPDCFGFGHALPTIAAHCGLKGFSAQKFGNWGAPAELPFHIGRWLGPDGQGVVAALRPEGYGEGLHEDVSEAERWYSRIARQHETSGLAVAFMYVGLGDRGGRLAEESLAWIDRSLDGKGPIHVVQTASDDLFRALSAEQIERLPQHQGELLLPTHGTGCWTSQAAAKRWNRDCEIQADVAERAATIADWLGVMPYPGDSLRTAWKRFLWHQMHDDLTGTSIPEAYRYTWNDQLIALNEFGTVLDDAAGAVGAHLDTTGPGLPLVLFNPLAHQRCDLVEVELDWPEAPRAIEARGPGGETVPVQIVSRGPGGLRVVFAPPLAALGFSVWKLRPATKPEPDTDLEVTPTSLANGHFRLTLNDRGEVASILDRRADTQLLAAPLALELLKDRSSRWPAWEILHRDIEAPAKPLGGRPTVRVVESGPVRAVLEVVRSAAGSSFRQRISLAAASSAGAGSRIEVEHRIDWRTRGRLLKLALHQEPREPQAVFGLGCGTIARGINTRAKYEVPGLWAAPAGGGLSLIAERHSGWDQPEAGTVRLSLLRSPRVGRKFRHQGSQDHGLHTLRCALVRHDDIDATEHGAAAFALGPRAWQQGHHSGNLGREVSLFSLDSGATVRALKKAEDGDGMVVRLQETGGRRRAVSLSPITRSARRVHRLGGSEKPFAGEGGEPLHGGRLALDLEPYGLRTLRLDLESPSLAPAIAYRSMELPFDLQVTCRQNEAPQTDLAADSALPSELWPGSLQSGAVPFTLGPSAGLNAARCLGQRLSWRGAASKLWLVAAGLDRSHRARFELEDRSVALEIDFWGGIVGCFKGWRRGIKHLQWARPGGGFVRRHAIAWTATHRHDQRGADLPYDFGYLFRYALDLGSSQRGITLPRCPGVVLFAATLESCCSPEN